MKRSLTAFAVLPLIGLGACAQNINPTPLSGPAPQFIPTNAPVKQCFAKELAGKPAITIAVSTIADKTGKVKLADDGVGAFVTQGASDMMISALYQTGSVKLVERLNRDVLTYEQEMALKKVLGDGKPDTVTDSSGVPRVVPYRAVNMGSVLGSDYYITGSITALDFNEDSKSAEVVVAGVGAKARNYSAVVSLDLRLINTKTGQIVSVVPMQKVTVGEEYGASVGRFFGTTLTEVGLGSKRTEALGVALRSMLQLASVKMLSDVYGNDACMTELNKATSAPKEAVKASS